MLQVTEKIQKKISSLSEFLHSTRTKTGRLYSVMYNLMQFCLIKDWIDDEVTSFLCLTSIFLHKTCKGISTLVRNKSIIEVFFKIVVKLLSTLSNYINRCFPSNCQYIF